MITKRKRQGTGNDASKNVRVAPRDEQWQDSWEVIEPNRNGQFWTNEIKPLPNVQTTEPL